jgi:hypothetical protein
MNGLLSILLQNMNPGKGTFALPYDSTQGFTAKGQIILLLIIIIFGLYVGFRVWWSLRKEKMNKK